MQAINPAKGRGNSGAFFAMIRGPRTKDWANHTKATNMRALQTPSARSVWDVEILKHLPALHRYAFSLARNFHAAEDLVHDTVVKAYSCADKFHADSNLRAWLFTILRNTFYSGTRKQKHEVADPDGQYAACLVTHPAHDGRLAMSEFFGAFGQLSAEHRDIVTLVGVSGYSYKVASRMVGIPVGTAKSRLSRARTQLTEMLDLPAMAPFDRLADRTILPLPKNASLNDKWSVH
jgi:RNA polymerase sigma-70 factor, ECF subfamily